MAPLSMRRARGVRRKRWSAAPNASQGRQLGKATRENRTAKMTAWARAPPARRSRKVAMAGCGHVPFGAPRGRDPPGHPAEHRRPAPLEDLQCQGVGKEHVAQSQGDREQHRAHPGHLSQQARESPPDTGVRTDRGQQRIAGAGGSSNDRGERDERDHLGGVMYYFHVPLS